MIRATTTCLGLLLIVSITQLVALAHSAGDNKILESSPPVPVFATNYHVRGVLSLPYAELHEPFEAWYDKNNSRSRTDYFGDLYQVYQFGPKSAPDQSGSEYGSIYKLTWVPTDFYHDGDEKVKTSGFGKVLSKLKSVTHLHKSADEIGQTQTKRACFSVNGGVGSTISAQSVLPNLADYTYDSTGRCPHVNLERRHTKCELWTYVKIVGEKKNTYKMWVAREPGTRAAIPVFYYMLGYDTLLGSHYDRYDISYSNFKANEADDEDFLLDSKDLKCGSMPGPGDSASSGERRSHMIIQNPIHEYVEEPHRYDHADHEFEQFASEHNKDYHSEEHQRKSWFNFLHNFRFINGKNRELKEYKLAVNKFADNNVRELSYLRGRLHSTGYNGGLDYEKHHQLKSANGQQQQQKLPDTWDWEIRGAVTAVKDQATCGSCWSFGTSGTIEGAYFVKTGKLPRLSQQQMVDCSWKFGNNGCDGGEDFRAYKYIMEAGGLATEEDYGHYLGVDGRCHDKETRKAVQITNFYNVTPSDPEALKHALINYGPVTVAIDASRPTFTFYSHGVYYDPKCNNSPDGLDHQVLVVGYTTVDDQFVWLVKNSWSTNWGNNGYILMSAKDNNCGLMDAPTVPIIKV